MSNPVVLFYNLDNEKGRKLKLICLKLKLKIRIIYPEQYFEPIGFLAGLAKVTSSKKPFNETGFSDEMLVMKGFDNRLLDLFLLEFKKNHIERIHLKAVITDQNMYWDSIKLHAELISEHEAMS